MKAYRKKYRFLFVGAMILGKNTAFRNLRDAICGMDDVESTWVPIEMRPDDRIARIPPVSWNHSLMFGLVARSRIRGLERSGKVFDGAFFNHILPAVFLRRFRDRVPSVDSLDTTPKTLLEHGQPYYERPRSAGNPRLRSYKDRLARSIYRQAEYVLPYSKFTRSSLVRDYGVPEDRLMVLAPGVDLAMWPGRNGHGTDRKPGEPVRVLFVGGDFIRKGGDLVIDVAGRPEFSGCEFHIVSSSFRGEKLRNVSVHDHISANSDAMRELYRSADIFAMPTRSDFSPTNSICEAMAMGLPVIATSVGGLDEVVINGKTGFTVPVGDADAVAAKLRLLVSDPDLRRCLGNGGRALAEERFDVSRNARTIVECLIRAAERRSR